MGQLDILMVHTDYIGYGKRREGIFCVEAYVEQYQRLTDLKLLSHLVSKSNHFKFVLVI